MDNSIAFDDLIDCLTDPKDKSGFFIYSCKFGKTDFVKTLLEDPDVDPTMDRNMAICQASMEGHSEIVKLLLQDKRIDPTTRNNMPLFISILKGNISVVKELLKNPSVRNKAKERDGKEYVTAAVSEGYMKGHGKAIRVLFKEKILVFYNDSERLFAKINNL